MNNEKDTIPTGETLTQKPAVKLTQALSDEYQCLIGNLRELDTNISSLQQEYSAKLEQLQAKKKTLEEAIQHLVALLHFEGYHVDNVKASNDDDLEIFNLERISVADSAFSLLEELHQPLHYKEIASKLQERNIHIPGKNPAATLLSRINRDKRFRRSKNRGVYALSTWRIRKTKSKSTKRKTKRRV